MEKNNRTEPAAFDTHKFVKRLTENGFTERQAEVLADEHVNLLNSNLATKADIGSLRQATKADIESLRQATKADIEKLKLATMAEIAATKVELLKWFLGALIAQAGLIVALIKLLWPLAASRKGLLRPPAFTACRKRPRLLGRACRRLALA